MNEQPATVDMTKCFVARFESAVCHVVVVEAPGLVKAMPWVQDHVLDRPVLNAGGYELEFLADGEDMALLAVVEFLEGRFGSMADPPRLCNTPEHMRAHILPLASADASASA